ncbi:hypothetical protein D8770_19745 [Methylobacterium sp. DB1607]|nr:hypothetical protein [Methylobacterium sp. DB1607]
MAITRASTNPDGSQANDFSTEPSLSADGNLVAFTSKATNLGFPTNDPSIVSVYVKNLTTGEIIRASNSSDGRALRNSNFGPSLAADGSAVAFLTNASDLVSSTSEQQVAVKSLGNGDLSIVSTAADGTQANAPINSVSIADDGRAVVFSTTASNLVPNDTNGFTDLFLKDLSTGAIARVSTAADGSQSNGNSIDAVMTADRRFVAFQSAATNLVAGDTNGNSDIFVKNLTTGAIVNASTAADGTLGNGFSTGASLSRDGNFVAFTSTASNLVAGDTNGRADVFVKNLTTGAIARVSTAADGTQGNGETGFFPRISADGTKVTFTSRASNLVAGDTNTVADVFVKDLTTGGVIRVSTAANGEQVNSQITGIALSADGSRAAFASTATNLVPGDTNNTFDVFVSDVICFATGTRIRTARGEVAVEDLRVGDQAVTVGGKQRPIRWIGSRSLDGRGAALPFAQQPVRIRAGAFGDGLPVRDLFLSPGHPVLVGGHLVPVMSLVNGTSLARMPATAVTYWHVELDAHDILLAEGLPAESYLDLGSRPWFARSDAPLHDPEFAAVDAPGRCRPLAVEGPVVEAERRRLDDLFAAVLAGACAWGEAGPPWITA